MNDNKLQIGNTKIRFKIKINVLIPLSSYKYVYSLRWKLFHLDCHPLADGKAAHITIEPVDTAIDSRDWSTYLSSF